MRQVYKNSGKVLSGFLCCSMGYRDLVLAGPGGEIWEFKPGEYRVCTARKDGSEKVIKINEYQIKKWIGRLKISLSVDEQLYWANNPNAKHDWASND